MYINSLSCLKAIVKSKGKLIAINIEDLKRVATSAIAIVELYKAIQKKAFWIYQYYFGPLNMYIT